VTRLWLPVAVVAAAAACSPQPDPGSVPETTTSSVQTDFEWCMSVVDAAEMTPEYCAPLRGQDQPTLEGCRRTLTESDMENSPLWAGCDEFPTQAQIDRERGED
jgi:hypothetical protein